ncbi:MAG: DUF2621 family protein [Acidobacteriia bacterium]|nr:DUF2621 family protein [Terriglobia bacterium]
MTERQVVERVLRMNWSTEATTQFESMLNDVPAMMRGMARSMASAEAERVAAERGATEVSVDDLIRGMIRATPSDFRETVKQLLQGHGIDPATYASEFGS